MSAELPGDQDDSLVLNQVTLDFSLQLLITKSQILLHIVLFINLDKSIISF